jgi:hypothetical protein
MQNYAIGDLIRQESAVGYEEIVLRLVDIAPRIHARHAHPDAEELGALADDRHIIEPHVNVAIQWGFVSHSDQRNRRTAHAGGWEVSDLLLGMKSDVKGHPRPTFLTFRKAMVSGKRSSAGTRNQPGVPTRGVPIPGGWSAESA